MSRSTDVQNFVESALPQTKSTDGNRTKVDDKIFPSDMSSLSLSSQDNPFVARMNIKDFEDYINPREIDKKISYIMYDEKKRCMFVCLMDSKTRNPVCQIRKFTDFNADMYINNHEQSWCSFMIGKFGNEYEQALEKDNLSTSLKSKSRKTTDKASTKQQATSNTL